jgi:hypothetical protein
VILPTAETLLDEDDKVWVLLKSQFVKSVSKLFVPPG